MSDDKDSAPIDADDDGEDEPEVKSGKTKYGATNFFSMKTLKFFILFLILIIIGLSNVFVDNVLSKIDGLTLGREVTKKGVAATAVLICATGFAGKFFIDYGYL